ncbi:hypothetical protein ACFQY8_01500 [Alloscardovia venturai]|uniref:Cell division protein n=1 Tax=Alloscardovia venturai TaxID=1769421 RepID=A0ABW2Y4G6_9BIFI
MADAYNYDPDAQFDDTEDVDDSTGDAQVTHLAETSSHTVAPAAIPGVEDAQAAAAETHGASADTTAANLPSIEQKNTSESQDTARNTSKSDESEESPVSPQTQAAINAFIPNAEDAENPVSSTEDQFTTAYDIIDQIDTLVAQAPRYLFGRGQVRVNHDELRDLLDELKSVLPVQLERASTLMREAERRLENAQSQSDAIVNNAQAKAATIIKDANDRARFLAGQENVVSLATEQARTILNNAQDKANTLTKGANDYTVESMKALDEKIIELRHSISSGLQVLQERQRLAEQDIPRLTPEDFPQN